MRIDNIYPHQSRKRMRMQMARTFVKWIFIIAAITCPLINLYLGGKPWSVVVMWGLWMV